MLIPMNEIILDSTSRGGLIKILIKYGYKGKKVNVYKSKYDPRRKTTVTAYSIIQVEQVLRNIRSDKSKVTSWETIKKLEDVIVKMKKYNGVIFDLKGNKIDQLSNKQIQVLLLSTQYVYSFLQDAKHKHLDVEKLDSTLCKLAVNYTHDLNKQLKYAYEYLEKITEGQELECNELALGINLTVMLAEAEVFNPTLNECLFKKANKISTQLEKEVGHEQGYKNALKLVHAFTKDMI